MSEALSSSEIEDVLSSIRRLVSDDMRPAALLGAAADRDKLLLTPSLRVVPSEPAADLDAPHAIDDVMAQLSAGVALQDDQWESETGDLVAEIPAHATAEAQDWQDHQIDAYAEAVAEVLVQAPFEMGDVLVAAPEPDVWAQVADDTETVASEPWAAGTIEPDPVWADEAEQAVLRELSDPAPVGVGPRTVQQAYDGELDGDDASEDGGDDSSAEVPVDEAMLREIVRDVLREELQGRLGERITRNIRKLVRAEIARVMAAEELF